MSKPVQEKLMDAKVVPRIFFMIDHDLMTRSDDGLRIEG